MTIIGNPQEKTKKCKEEIYAVLKKYNCGLTASPVFSTDEDGNVKAVSEVKVVPLFKPPVEAEYLN